MGKSTLFHLGTIRNKLLITFIMIVGLTVGISLVAILLFGSTRKATSTITTVEMPAVIRAYDLSVTAKGIAAASSSLATSRTETELEAANKTIHLLLESLNTRIGEFSERQSEKANIQRMKIHSFVYEFEPILNIIYEGRKEIITTQTKIDQLAEAGTTISSDLMNALEPLKTGAGQSLGRTLIQLSKTDAAEAELWRKHAFQNDLPNFQYSMEMGLSIQRINSHLLQAAGATTLDDLNFNRKSFSIYVDSLNEQLNNIRSKGTVTSLIDPIRALISIGQDQLNIFQLRTSQLQTMEKISDNIRKGHRIASELTFAAHAFSASIIESAKNTAERIHRSTRTGTFMAVAMAFGTIALSLAIGWRMVARDIVRRISTLQQMMIEGQQGNLNLNIDTRGEDEIADMSKAFAYFVKQMSRDIDTHKKNEKRIGDALKRAEAANEAKSRFLANMSHEIRTPMNGIIGYSSLLTETDLGVEQQGYAIAISTSADHLLVVINDILDFSKIEAGHLELEHVPFDLRDNLENAFNTMAIKAREKNLEVECRISGNVPERIVGDPARLRQIVVNLVGNAVKFTKAGKIGLTCNVRGTGEDDILLHISVSDTGIGIAKEKLEAIFDCFEQADTSTSREFGGTGLGLSISKHLTRLMGGHIWVESPANPEFSDASVDHRASGGNGPGSTFHFTIEAGLDKDHDGAPVMNPAAATKRPCEAQSPNQLKVLLVEDNSINQKMAVKILESRGYDITTADHGQHAIDILNSGCFDLVIMDVQMPVMDGITATQAIRSSQHQNRQVPIIAMTAHAMKGDKIKCIEAGMDDYISKPIDPGQLFTIIEKQVAVK